MKKINLFIVVICSFQQLFAQKAVIYEYAVTDKKALQLPDSSTTSTHDISKYIVTNFKTDKDKTRAIFIWLATNIQYDVENMFAINFYGTLEDKILKPLKTRRGICENYAALFNDISTKSGLKSFVVEGYTKQNGFASFIPHAWCATFVDSSWYLFDPTWGSGYVEKGRFIRKINNNYFKVDPSVHIKSHIPFDYLWQFLHYPVTNQEFYESKTQLDKSKPYFNFIDSIQVYENQNHFQKLISSAYRIEKNGIKNSLVFDRMQHIKLEIENDKQNKITSVYNLAVADYNDGISKFNDFINYRNKQFIPKQTDSATQSMIDSVSFKLKVSKTKLSQIENPDMQTANTISQLAKLIDELAIHAGEQQDWLKLYLSKGKLGRRSMFYKMTWFGIPLN